MHRTSLILLSAIVGLYCGFCHAESVGTKEYHERPIQVIEIEEPAPVYTLNLTDKEKNLMVRVVMSEVGNKAFDCKHAVAQTIINRYLAGFGDSIAEVINQPNAYSTQDNGEPNADCYLAVEWALSHPDVFPSDMYYFREYHYHEFGVPYTSIDGTYFSTESEAVWKQD